MNKNEKNLSGYGFSFKDYIRILENPDKIGLNNGIWSAPILKGYDKNQRGYGIDINTNKKAKALTNNRPGRWLTEKEADTLMDDHINYITEAANKHIKGFSELPFRRKWALLGMLYRGDSVNKSGININEPDDLKFFKSISDYYRSKGLNTRANSSDEFFNRSVSKLLSMFKLKQGGQVRKMQTAAGGPLQLTPEELKYLEWSKMTPELKREYRVNRAKSYLLSGPNITNFWEAFQTYIGNRDPENSHLQVGDVPNPGMRNPKLIIQGVLKAESIALRAAKISNKVFDRQYWRAISSGNSKRVLAVRNLHFSAKAPETKVVNIKGRPQLVIHKTPNHFTKFDNNRSYGKINWFATKNAFEGEEGVFATGAGRNPREIKLYVNIKNPHIPTLDEGVEPAYINEGEDGILAIVDNNYTNYFPSTSKAGKGFRISGGVNNPYALKSYNFITYDNNGNIIPISQRDNFSIDDIRYKQGGKMNILEFLKNGSGIHIKEKNKGKFTSYCGGKVTDECIRKAKASGNPTLVKRATFADNARHFKHKDGGKAFVSGVNVLDSNPKAYKYVKKKYRMALLGTKLNFFLKAGNFLNSDLGKTVGTGLVNAFSNWASSNKLNNAINSLIEGLKKQNKADINSIQNWALQKATEEVELEFNKLLLLFNSGASFEQPSPIVFEHLKSQLASKYAQKAIDYVNLNSQEDIANLESLKTNPMSDAFSSLVNTGINYFANKALNKNGVPSSRNTNISFYSNPYLKTLNKVGTINSNGSMNTGIGGTTYNWNTNTFGSNNTMNSFGNIKF